MAITEEQAVVIARSPADVFAHMTAVERWPEWLIASGIVRVTRDAPDRDLALGAGIHIDQVLAGIRSSTVVATVTAFEAPSRLGVAGKDADGVSVELDATLTPEGLGTSLAWRVRISLPFRLRIFEGMAAPQVRRAAALDLEAFKRRLESVAGT